MLGRKPHQKAGKTDILVKLSNQIFEKNNASIFSIFSIFPAWAAWPPFSETGGAKPQEASKARQKAAEAAQSQGVRLSQLGGIVRRTPQAAVKVTPWW